jgi:signal transduction histidine kinase
VAAQDLRQRIEALQAESDAQAAAIAEREAQLEEARRQSEVLETEKQARLVEARADVDRLETELLQLHEQASREHLDAETLRAENARIEAARVEAQAALVTLAQNRVRRAPFSPVRARRVVEMSGLGIHSEFNEAEDDSFADTVSIRLPGTLYILLALAAPVAGLFIYRLASRFNQAFVRSMELSIRNERLVTALEARTVELQRQTLAAERAERDKTRFLAAASHDLRQPMHAISLLVGMLRPRASSGQEHEVVERLERSIEAMDRLFGTILDLSKLDSGAVKPSIAAVPLRAILDSIEVHFAPQAASKQLALAIFPSRAIVSTDRVLMDRVLRNLVSNAIKYTNEGGVLVGCRRRGERLLVGVWDTGLGIATEDRERIFEEYFQVGSSPRDRGEGLGLGLSIVRRLARLLGSEVEVVSMPGRGSRLGLEVPFAGYVATEEERRGEESASETALSGKLVLVVDDEADVRFSTEALLRRWGCYAASAASVEEVVAILEHELRFPDAILTDYRLGDGQTGLDVITAVRQYTGEKTPAVIVTGEELEKAGLEIAGSVYPVIKKPLSAEQLRRYLVAAVGRDLEAPALNERVAK